MGIKQKFFSVLALLFLIISLLSYWILTNGHSKLIDMEANRIADIVSSQILADRAVYTKELVGKLENDGYGASSDSHKRPGFIMLPAQFVRTVSKKVADSSNDLYRYSLVSEWNLNKDQGLKDEFDQWAWAQLQKQNNEFTDKAPQSKEPYPWKPVYKIDNSSGSSILHYMRADPASAAACVSCHNRYEKEADVIAFRKKQHVETEKQWQLHELMGAIRVDIPLSSVQKQAESVETNLMISLAVLFIAGFGTLLFILYQNVIEPAEQAINDVAHFKELVDDVINKNREVLDGTDKQYELLTQDEVNINELQDIALKSASDAQLAAASCGNLEDGFKTLNDKMQKMLGKKS